MVCSVGYFRKLLPIGWCHHRQSLERRVASNHGTSSQATHELLSLHSVSRFLLCVCRFRWSPPACTYVCMYVRKPGLFRVHMPPYTAACMRRNSEKMSTIDPVLQLTYESRRTLQLRSRGHTFLLPSPPPHEGHNRNNNNNNNYIYIYLSIFTEICPPTHHPPTSKNK